MIMLSEWCRPSVRHERLVSNSVLYTTTVDFSHKSDNNISLDDFLVLH